MLPLTIDMPMRPQLLKFLQGTHEDHHLRPGTAQGVVSRGAQLVDAAGIRHLQGDALARSARRGAGVADGHDGALALPVQALVRIPKQ